MSTFEPGDVVCLRTGGPKMVVVDILGVDPGGNARPTYVLRWHQGESILTGFAPGVALRLVESAKPEERRPVYDAIRELCNATLGSGRESDFTLAVAILDLMGGRGL